MKILAIETSCDETAVCLIEATGDRGADFSFHVLGNELYSQIAIHAPYGGVFPNLAKREHAKNLIPLLTETLKKSNSLVHRVSSENSLGLQLENIRVILEREPELFEQLEQFLNQYQKPPIDAIAVTHGPGLEPALWVGVNLARALSLVWDIPLVAVNHMEGHIVMSMMQNSAMVEFSFPLLSLLISGGHTELVLSREWQQYEIIGSTRDDAVGEAFDKVARILGLPYPGGPEISRLAHESRSLKLSSQNTPSALTRANLSFTPPMLHSKDLDFSFSGIKTEVRTYVETHYRSATSRVGIDAALPEIDDLTRSEIARAFEDAVTQVLVAKTQSAVEEFTVATVVVGGGVSANTYIRQRLAVALAKAGNVRLLVPPPDLATDNALMIALAGYFHAIKKDFADPATLRANGNLRLTA